MRLFWKTVAANLVATCITLVVLAMLVAAGTVFLLAMAAGSHAQPGTPSDAVLVFDMDMSITDAPPRASPGDILGGSDESRLSLYELVSAIDNAASDKNIVAMYLTGSLDTDDDASGYAALREVRQAIARFEASGKKVYAYLIDPTMKDYYLASAANQIYLNPFGYISLNGLSAESLFLGDALKKYGVGVQVTRVGKYKSATEIFTERQMSAADREQLTQLLGSIWDEVLGEVSTSRAVDLPRLRDLSNNPGLYMAQDALQDKLVDKLGYLDQIIDDLRDVAGHDDDNNTFKQVEMSDYAERLTAQRDRRARSLFSTADHIAVVYAEGDIVDGAGEDGQVGGDQMAYDLRTLRNDDSVKAIVLRVNSPGGSALASEIIQREIRNLRDDKKPVVVSFGSVAASGGYWISAYGDYIFAEPTTITGSIGVFGMKFNIQDIANEHGITFDDVDTAKFADMDTISRPWTPDEEQLAQTLVDYLYDQFIAKVAEGRKLSVEHVSEIAQGRVWSGEDAKSRGLVDAIGGLGDAIAKAEDLGGLKGKSWTLEEFPERRTAAQALLDALAGNEQNAPVAKAGGLGLLPAGRDPVSVSIRQMESEWSLVRSFNDPRCMYARLPYLMQF